MWHVIEGGMWNGRAATLAQAVKQIGLTGRLTPRFPAGKSVGWVAFGNTEIVYQSDAERAGYRVVNSYKPMDLLYGQKVLEPIGKIAQNSCEKALTPSG